MINLFAASIHTLAVLGDLERKGCRVLSAHILPSPAVRITPPPAGVIGTFAFRPLPRGAWAAPVECSALVHGVRVSWLAGGVRHDQ